MSAGWTTRRATAGDQEAVLALLGRAHAGDETAALSVAEWEWLFLRNPGGAGLQYVVADAGARLAGQYATVPLRMQIGGVVAQGLLSLNTATDPEFQRQGIFTTLAETLYGEAEGSFALVYGFPNARSAPGFYRRLGWLDLGAPRLLLRPLRSPGRRFPRRGIALGLAVGAPALRALDAVGGRAPRAEPFDAFDSWADRIWARAAPALGTAAVRDAAFLRWRFDDAPREYRRWSVGEEPDGYAVSRLVPWRGTTIAYLMELIAPSRAVATGLLRAVMTDAHRDGAVAICAVATPHHPHRSALLRSGFLPVPVGLTPGLSFGVRALSDDVPRSAILSLDDWYLSAADYDWV